MLETTLRRLLSETELQITDLQISQLITFVELLDKWNKAYNLTSVRDPQQMLIKHIMDSIVVSPYLQSDKESPNIIDVGTGPGLPGIPLAIINPDKNFTLLDSLGKRIRFITQVKHQLKLDNVNPVQSRVEEFNGKFDLVLSRAFASMSDMVNWSKHLLADDGQFVALKGQLAQEEIAALPDFVKVEKTQSLFVPELNAERHLVFIHAT